MTLTTAGVSLHFIPGLLNALDERQDQIVRLRHPQQPQPQQVSSNRNSRLLLDAQVKNSMLNMHQSKIAQDLLFQVILQL